MSRTGSDRQLERRFPLAPGQKPVRSIEGKPPARVRLYDRYGVVAEELIEVVQIAVCLRPNIGGVQRAAADLVLAGHLKLAIEGAAAIGQRKDSRGSVSGVRTKSASRVALLESRSKKESGGNLPVELDVPTHTAWIAQTRGDRVYVGHGGKDLSRRIEALNRAVRQKRKGCNIERHAVVEQARTALEQRFCVLGQHEGEAGARRRIG